MNVLLTGANGFVGSRILRRLVSAGVAVSVLLRESSRRGLIHDLMDRVRVCVGSVEEVGTLDAALSGVTHVVHCAGKTKALRRAEFESVNVGGTRNLVEAVNRRGQDIRCFVHMSSLAAAGPAGADHPSRESDSPAPVSAYGRSKLAGEAVVRSQCGVPWVILRPSGVYGPGDVDFLQLFRAARWRVSPMFGGGRQPLNLVYVDDLAEVVRVALTRGRAEPEPVYNVAHAEVVTAAELALEVARQMKVRVLQLPLPNSVLTPVAVAGEVVSWITRRPAILSLERRHELQACGWVCDTTRLSAGLGVHCPTGLSAGLASTLAWYRGSGWL